MPNDVAAPWIAVGSIFALIGVALGAFAAHSLKGRIDDSALATFEVGVRYQMYHSLAILAAAWLCSIKPSSTATASAILFTVGIVLFSGSIYGLALAGWKWLGPVTPLGGVAFMAGWLCMAIAALRKSA